MRDKRKVKADLHKYLESLHDHVARSKRAEAGKSQEEAGESEQIFRVIFDNAADGILLADVESKKFYIGNKVICQMLGYNENELKELGVIDIHPEESLSYVIEQFEKQMKGEITLAKDMPVIRKDGSVFYADINAFPITFGGKTYLMGIFRDITERRNAEEEVRKFKTIADTAAYGVAISDLDGNLTYTNEPFAKMHGFKTDELIGKNLVIFHNEEQIEDVNKLNAQLMEKGNFVAEEVWHCRRDGTTFCTLMHGTLIRDENGQPQFLTCTALDITERKRMEKELHDSEEKYRTLVESARDPIVVINADGVFLFVNEAMAKDFGCQPEDLVAKTLWDIFPKDDADQNVATVRKVIDTGEGTNLIVLTDIRGEPRWHNVNIEPLKDDSGKAIAAMVIARNIHDIKQAEEQIRKLSSAVEQSIDGIAISTLIPKVLYANKAYARMHGYTPEEMVGMEVAALQSNEYIDKYERAKYIIKTQGSWSGETMHVKKDGTDFPVYMSVTLLKDDTGQATGVIAVCKDITEYKKAQKDLMIKDAAIASSINAIAIGDLDGNVMYVNDSCLKIWGYSDANEVLGRNVVEFWQNKEDAIKAIKTMRVKGSWMGEKVAVRKDGSVFDVQICATLIKDENNKAISMMGSFIDITESKRSREQLNAYREKMARTEQLASLGTLSATLAHELTQPLTIIRLSLESAAERLGIISSQEFLANKIEDSLNQISSMAAITERFRNFARRSSEHIIGEVDLKAIANRIVNFLSESARQVKVELRLEDWDELPVIYWNENDLEQLFFALVNNAIQAADGKKPRQLIIQGRIKNKNIELQFSDNCGGIAPDNLDRIFEPFFTTKPSGLGTGLGLCIVQDVVTRAGGKIHVESEFGEGSTFFVTLPVSEDRTSQLDSGK